MAKKKYKFQRRKKTGIPVWVIAAGAYLAYEVMKQKTTTPDAPPNIDVAPGPGKIALTPARRRLVDSGLTQKNYL